MYQYALSDDGQELSILSGGQATRFHSIWLRDNAQDPLTRSKENGQRLITLRDIPGDLKIDSVEIVNDTAKITFVPPATTISYNIPWLLKNQYEHKNTDNQLVRPDIETWDASFANRVPNDDMQAIQNNAELLKNWLAKVARFGFARLHNCPVENEALYRVVDLFGFIRETNYGRHFEVRTEINASNLAYTGMALQAHTDNPYRDPVPSLQILYCLESSAAGGESMVVDGFRIAHRLRTENQEWFDVLTEHCAQFEYNGSNGVCLQASHPMIELATDGNLKAIHFNNRSATTFTDVPFSKMQTYYDAYRRLGELVDDPAMEVSFRLDPGECFIVDNLRVLHARKAYSGTGTRWLQGCYADKDGLNSTLAYLESSITKSN